MNRRTRSSEIACRNPVIGSWVLLSPPREMCQRIHPGEIGYRTQWALRRRMSIGKRRSLQLTPNRQCTFLAAAVLEMRFGLLSTGDGSGSSANLASTVDFVLQGDQSTKRNQRFQSASHIKLPGLNERGQLPDVAEILRDQGLKLILWRRAAKSSSLPHGLYR